MSQKNLPLPPLLPKVNVASTLNWSTLNGGVGKFCLIFLKNPFSWQCNDLGQKCIILRQPFFLIGSNAPVTEKDKRTNASWLPSQHPAMLWTIKKEGTAIKPLFCGNWYDRIEEKEWTGLVPSQNLISNFKFPSVYMGFLSSLIGNLRPLTFAAMLPVTNASPTEWQNLYTAIKEAEKLRQCVWSDGKAVISFNLQLCIKAIRLQQKPDVRDNFVFWMGELHVVLCVIKVLGKLIDAVDWTKNLSKQVLSTELGFVIYDIIGVQSPCLNFP